MGYSAKTKTSAIICVNLIEKSTVESLRDIGFSKTSISKMNGIDLRIVRTRISGELGHELDNTFLYSDA